MALLKSKEVAAMLRVSPQTVNTLIRTNRLRAIAVGQSYRIDSADLSRYLKENYTEVSEAEKSTDLAAE